MDVTLWFSVIFKGLQQRVVLWAAPSPYREKAPALCVRLLSECFKVLLPSKNMVLGLWWLDFPWGVSAGLCLCVALWWTGNLSRVFSAFNLWQLGYALLTPCSGNDGWNLSPFSCLSSHFCVLLFHAVFYLVIVFKCVFVMASDKLDISFKIRSISVSPSVLPSIHQ